MTGWSSLTWTVKHEQPTSPKDGDSFNYAETGLPPVSSVPVSSGLEPPTTIRANWSLSSDRARATTTDHCSLYKLCGASGPPLTHQSTASTEPFSISLGLADGSAEADFRGRQTSGQCPRFLAALREALQAWRDLSALRAARPSRSKENQQTGRLKEDKRKNPESNWAHLAAGAAAGMLCSAHHPAGRVARAWAEGQPACRSAVTEQAQAVGSSGAQFHRSARHQDWRKAATDESALDGDSLRRRAAIIVQAPLWRRLTRRQPAGTSAGCDLLTERSRA